MLFVVVGPSGAGKDSLIGYARRALSSDGAIRFVRRVVTRTAVAAAEEHDSLSEAEFAAAEQAGRFAVSWEAHGLRYGVPVSARAHMENGGVAILNGSRAALAAIRAAFDPVTVVHVTARPDVVAARLAQRRREAAADIARRLSRAAIDLDGGGGTVEIDNSGDLAVAGEALVAAIRRIRPA